MKFRAGLAQTCHPDDGDVVSLVERYAAAAQESRCSLLVFPECLMTRYEEDKGAFLAAAEPLDGPFATAMNAIAERYGLWMVYTVNEANPDSELPFNTVAVTDDTGTMRGFYRKVHLFDSATTQESSRMSAGAQLFEPIETPFGKLGMAICYDLRFPEVARAAALQGADIMVYPAAWVDGPGKANQWETLLAARAIENQLFVLGVCRADEGYVGRSCAWAPDGRILAHGDSDEALLVALLDTDELARMRTAIPVFDHRRPGLYGCAF